MTKTAQIGFLARLLRAAMALLLLTAGAAWSQTALVSAGSAWKYLDNGSNQGTAWRASGFDDSAWPSGAAQLGYGDGDEATVVSFGANASLKHITTYFRRSFSVVDPAAFTALNLRLKRDDGVVVYLNGTEVHRDNLPAGSISSTTLASTTAADDGATWQAVTLASTGLVAGINVLAVEIHQAARDSSDISFDLELTGSASGVSVSRKPYLQLGTPGSVVVRWRTNTPTDSRVWFGAAPTSLTSSVSDALQTTEHSITLTGLSANTRYFYSVGSTTQGLAGGDTNHYFVTAPAPNSDRASRIWVLGDAGTGTAGQNRVRDAYYNFTGATHTDLWLQLGDNAYDNGTDAEYQAKLFDVYADMLRKSVTWPTIGNHDTADSPAPPASLPYFQMFNFPTAAQAGGVASGSKNYYSFDYGNIHFISLDSMASSRAAGSAMLNWLQSDLAANTKQWTIAFWHHPPYSKGSHDSDVDVESIEMRQNALPILENFGVDLVLSGHSHTYERSYLIDGHYGASSSFTNAMKKNGGSGRPAETGAYTKPLGPTARQGAVYAVAGSSGKVESGPLNHPAMFVSLLELGSVVIDASATHLDVKFLGDTGTLRDSFTISKSAATNPPPSVTLTAPSSGSSATAPATFNLAANASDSNGSIARVEFYQGSTLLGSDTSAPYTFTWAGVTAGSYSITARAFDNQGASTTSAAASVSVTAPNQPPSVALTAPTSGSIVTAPAAFTLTASASDADGSIARVEFYQGSTLLATDTTAPYSYLWTGVAAGSYSLSARAYDNLGAMTTSAAASVTVNPAPNQAPTVSLTSPAAGATATAPATINLAANASDADGSIARVEFYQGATLLAGDTSAPYSFAWTNVAAGSYTITARAFDNLGAATDSAAVSITVNAATAQPVTLIGRGSAWKYLDNGSNQGTAWRASSFDDTAWASGAGQLGYGDGDETTLLSFGPNASAKYITTYFRRTITVTNPAQFTSLLINLLRDDGAVVYLNGVEIARSNMPTGTVASSTRASTAIGTADESAYNAFTVNTAALLAGVNVIAVEIHQAAPDSSDVSFDLELIARP
jgi:Bacterial Ig domain/Calcineurin-like phosphoesterase/Purple acid Phosphatase, N-terminal domain